MGSSLGSCWEFAGFLALRHQYRVLQKVVFETYRDAEGKGEEMSLREDLLRLHKICECRCGAPGWRTTTLGVGLRDVTHARFGRFGVPFL
jgi:hypothetical protein